MCLKKIKINLTNTQQIWTKIGNKIVSKIPNNFKPIKIKINVEVEFKPMEFSKIFGSIKLLTIVFKRKIAIISNLSWKLLEQKLKIIHGKNSNHVTN